MTDQITEPNKEINEKKEPTPNQPKSSPDKEVAEETAKMPKDFSWGDGLSLDVSACKMSARLELSVEYAECYSANDLYRFLRGNRVIYEINKSQLQKIIDNKIFNEPVLVSKGLQLQNGKDGYVDWKVDLSILDGAKLVEHGGQVDWKDQHHVLQVEEDELLGILIPPTNGEPGKNVYGEAIPSKPGKPAKFPAGKGVRISEDGNELYSEIKGVVCREGEKISVTTTYSVEGDIDFKSGNVNYGGTVMITGSVLTDFKVEAGNDIHINGIVEGAILIAEGNIFINGGIQGDQKAKITAGGDVTAKFINNATVTAGKDVVVSGAISNSIIKANKRVLLDGPKTTIVGGEITAEEEISASVIGSELGVKTKLELGVEINKRIDLKNEQSQKINSLIENYKKLQQATSTLNQLRDAGKLSPEQTELRLKIIRSGLQLQSQVKRMQEDQRLIKEEIDGALSRITGVVAKQVAWPGTQITILGNSLTVKSQTSKAFFLLIKNEINVFAYKERDDKDKKKKGDDTDKKDAEGSGEESTDDAKKVEAK